jgi:hypothetical protein
VSGLSCGRAIISLNSPLSISDVPVTGARDPQFPVFPEEVA